MNPRNDQVLLDQQNAYADAMIQRDKLRGYPQQDQLNERSPDGRSLYLESLGYYKPEKVKPL